MKPVTFDTELRLRCTGDMLKRVQHIATLTRRQLPDVIRIALEDRLTELEKLDADKLKAAFNKPT